MSSWSTYGDWSESVQRIGSVGGLSILVGEFTQLSGQTTTYQTTKLGNTVIVGLACSDSLLDSSAKAVGYCSSITVSATTGSPNVRWAICDSTLSGKIQYVLIGI